MPTRTGYITGLYRGHLEGSSSSRHGGGDKVWGWLCCLLFVILLASVVVLVALGAKESLADLPYFYSPQDSRLVRQETTLCRGRVDPDGQVLLNRFHGHLVLPLHATAVLVTRTERLHSHQELHPDCKW